jgi:hypothetical protein
MSDNETSDTATKTAGGRPVLGDPDVDLPEEEAAAAGEAATSPDAARCLSSAALDAALTADVAARLRGSDAIALTVRVPSSAWVAPLKSAFVRLNRLELVARDGSSRTQHKAESGDDEVSKYLSSGRSVVGIANSIAMLPRSLVAAADAVEYGPARAWGLVLGRDSRPRHRDPAPRTCGAGRHRAGAGRTAPPRRRRDPAAVRREFEPAGEAGIMLIVGIDILPRGDNDGHRRTRRTARPPGPRLHGGRPRPAAKRPGAPAAGLREHPKGRLRRALTGRDNRCRTEARSAAPTNFQ